MISVPKNLADQIIISIYVRRDLHENGMTLKEYADAVIAGTQPILGHDEYVYQFGAIEDEVNLVVEWATTNSLAVIKSDVAIATVQVQGTIEKFNELFKIQVITVTDDSGRSYMSHNNPITVPSEIDGVVDAILGFDETNQVVPHFKSVSPEGIDPSPAPNAYPFKYGVTPIQVSTAYQVPPGDGNGQTIAIIEFQGSGWNQTDVNSSFAQIGITTPPTVTNYSVDGATFTTYSDIETMMDIYCAGGVSPKANIVVYYAPNTSQGFYDMISQIAADDVNNPSVLTVSWGYGGDMWDYLSVPLQSCVAKGILVFFSSGDDGGNNWTACYPATSPYVIAAGGTSIFLNSDDTLNTETVWSGSGGGISTWNSRPSWQTTPSIYYTTYSTSGVLGTPTLVNNRGVPDISAPADPYTGYTFYVNNSLVSSGGTSAAAPFLAGVFARLNQLLGRRITLGEVMNLVYSDVSTSTDVTVGYNNHAWHQYGTPLTNGYAATSGWDAATGLGSPNVTNIYKHFRIGSVFPKENYSFRLKKGSLYPRYPRYNIPGRVVPTGDAVFTTPGTFTWTAPSGVTSVCAVCVGGGGGGDAGGNSGGTSNYWTGSGSGGALGWKNNIPVTPGQTYTVVVGAGGLDALLANGGSQNGGNSWFISTSTVLAEGGVGGVGWYDHNGLHPSNFIGDGGGHGGSGCGNGYDQTPNHGYAGFGGGGAGGYSGNGGDGGGGGNSTGDGTGGGYAGFNASANSGGGAGGGYQMSGGGVGIYGRGTTGTAPGRSSGGGYYSGRPGSGGTDVTYGGGAGGGSYHHSPNNGGGGAVRIIWGAGRSFPDNAA